MEQRAAATLEQQSCLLSNPVPKGSVHTCTMQELQPPAPCGLKVFPKISVSFALNHIITAFHPDPTRCGCPAPEIVAPFPWARAQEGILVGNHEYPPGCKREASVSAGDAACRGVGGSRLAACSYFPHTSHRNKHPPSGRHYSSGREEDPTRPHLLLPSNYLPFGTI